MGSLLQLIYETHPEVLNVDANGRPYVRCGAECGIGWYPLIIRTLDEIQDICKEKSVPYPKLEQVKEKFGALRIYINSGTDEIYDVLDKAEEESLFICEQSGLDGELYKKGYWVRTLNEKYAKKEGCVKCRTE